MRLRRGQRHDKPRPISAYRLALALGVRPGGNKDSRKRGIRKIIKMLRDAGDPIAHSFAGYWWAETVGDHQAYRRQRRRDAMRHLAAESADKRSAAAAQAAGQMGLFGDDGPTLETQSTGVQTAVECG